MNIFEKYGLVSSATKSVSKSNPLSLSHIKIELFHKNRELFLKELMGLYEARREEFQEKLETAKFDLENQRFRSDKSRALAKEKVKKLEKKIEAVNDLISHHKLFLGELFTLMELLDSGNMVEHDPNYLCHSPKWIRKEFLNFKVIRDIVVPILSRIQNALAAVSNSTGVCGWYFNHLVRTFILYLTTFFHSRDNQGSMERLGYLLNRAYKNSSGFGGRERRTQREMTVAGSINEIRVNRKIDTIVGAKARILIRQRSKRKDSM